MRQLERRVEVISGEFSLQELDKTVRAFVTMGRKPGERMMGQLEELRDSELHPSYSPPHPCDHGILVIPRFTRGKSILISPGDVYTPVPSFPRIKRETDSDPSFPLIKRETDSDYVFFQQHASLPTLDASH